MSKLTKVVTGDGSITFHNSDVDESYHSSSGAIDEALRKHVLPSDVIEFSKNNDEVVIGDVCFGLGYNSLVAINEIRKVNPNCHIQIFAFENDYEILSQISNLDLPSDYSYSLDVLSKLVSKEFLIEENQNFNLHVYCDDNLTISLYVGDVLTCLPNLSDDVLNVVFFDPFSPKKHPHLWSLDFLSSVFKTLKMGGVLNTYSCARLVRDNLREAGFFVKDGPSVGRRAPSTIAIKN